jgi:hypothetical protein
MELMRYRIGSDPGSGAQATDDMLLVTVIMSLIIGFVLMWLARHGRQMWLMVWSVGLVLASVAYLIWMALA